MQIPSVIIPYINYALIIFVIIRIIIGYKNGLIYSLYSLFAVLLAVFLAWYFGPILANNIQIYPEKFIPFASTEFGEAFKSTLNVVCWYLILFFGILLLSVLLKPFAKAIVELPIITTINHILGGVFAIIPSLITMILLAMILSAPLFGNGKEVLDGCWLGRIKEHTVNAISIIKEPLDTGEAIQKLINKQQELTQEDVNALFNWLSSKGLDSKKITEFLNEHTIFEVKEENFKEKE